MDVATSNLELFLMFNSFEDNTTEEVNNEVMDMEKEDVILTRL